MPVCTLIVASATRSYHCALLAALSLNLSFPRKRNIYSRASSLTFPRDFRLNPRLFSSYVLWNTNTILSDASRTSTYAPSSNIIKQILQHPQPQTPHLTLPPADPPTTYCNDDRLFSQPTASACSTERLPRGSSRTNDNNNQGLPISCAVVRRKSPKVLINSLMP